MNVLMSSLMLLSFMTESYKTSDLVTVKTFEPAQGDVFLADPHFFDFSDDGRLYILERNEPRVHHWAADGTYKGHFAKEGNGPGELYSPRMIHVSKDKVWVWNRNNKFSVFRLDGTWIRDFRGPNAQIRRFAVLDDNLLLIAYQTQQASGDTYVFFELINGKGKRQKTLKKIKNEMFLRPVQDEDGGRIKAYGPELDITTNAKGETWFGFSQERKLYRIDNKGEIVETREVTFKTGPITDIERHDFESISFPGPNGKVFTLKDMPNLSISYDFEKSYYTHLFLKDGTLATVLTPASGNDQHKGYFIGSYYLYDWASGEVKGRGNYRMPEDALVLIANGRALKLTTDESGDYVIEEIVLKGM